MDTIIYVNRSHSVVSFAITDQEVPIADIIEGSITFNQPIKYHLRKLEPRVRVIYGDQIRTGKLVAKEGKFVTIEISNGDHVTLRYDEIIEENLQNSYKIQIIDLVPEGLILNCETSSITWIPQVVLRITGNRAKLIYNAVLTASGNMEIEGTFYLSLYERPQYVRPASLMSSSRMMIQENEQSSDATEDYKYHVGHLILKDTLVLPINHKVVDITKYLLLDLYAERTSPQPIEGIGFRSPFYLPTSTLYLYDDAFNMITNVKSSQEQQFVIVPMRKSQKVQWTVTIVPSDLKDAIEYEWDIHMKNAGPAQKVLVSYYSAVSIIKSSHQPKKEYQETGVYRWIFECPPGESTKLLWIHVPKTVATEISND